MPELLKKVLTAVIIAVVAELAKLVTAEAKKI